MIGVQPEQKRLTSTHVFSVDALEVFYFRPIFTGTHITCMTQPPKCKHLTHYAYTQHMLNDVELIEATNED